MTFNQNPIDNDEMMDSIRSLLADKLGVYKSGNKELPAIYFDSAPETTDVIGLEVIVSPKSSVSERFGCCNEVTSTWTISLIQHHGRVTIYDAVDALTAIGQKYRSIWNKLDRAIGLKPACVVRIETVYTS